MAILHGPSHKEALLRGGLMTSFEVKYYPYVTRFLALEVS